MTRSTKKWRIGKQPLSSLITVVGNTSFHPTFDLYGSTLIVIVGAGEVASG